MNSTDYSYHNKSYKIDIDSVNDAIKEYNKLRGENKSTWLGMKIGEGNTIKFEAKKVGCWEIIQRFLGFGEVDWNFKGVSSCLSKCISANLLEKTELIKFELDVAKSMQKHQGKPIHNLFKNIFRLESIDIPVKTDFAYRGSNAVYLFLNTKGSACSLEEYKTTLPVTNQRFPRPKTEINGIDKESLAKLQENESLQIEAKVKDIDLTAIKIPKTLYDLFYWRFHLEDRQNGKIKTEDREKVYETAKRKFKEGKADTAEPCISKLMSERFYTYDKEGKGRICINVPELSFRISEKKKAKHQPPEGGLSSYSSFVENRYMKRESQDTYQQVTFQLNERIITYLKGRFLKRADPCDFCKSCFPNLKILQEFIYDLYSTSHISAF